MTRIGRIGADPPPNAPIFFGFFVAIRSRYGADRRRGGATIKVIMSR